MTLSWTLCNCFGFDPGECRHEEKIKWVRSTRLFSRGCAGPGGHVRSYAIVTMLPLAPQGDFTALPNIIEPGQTSQLDWNIKYPFSCCLMGVKRDLPPDDKARVSPTRTKIYTLNCRSDVGSYKRARGVIVEQPPPTGTFSVSPNVIDPGKTATLNWNISNVDGCTLWGRGFTTRCGWRRSCGTVVPAQGVRETPVLTWPGFYTLTCSNLSGSIDITRGYVAQHAEDAIAPTATILDAFYLPLARPPHDWWNRDFNVAVRWEDNKALACCLFRTAWMPEERPRRDFVYTRWINLCPAGGQSHADLIRMRVPGVCRTQGEAACKIEVRAIDMAGNVSLIWPKFFNIDWTPPVVEIREIVPVP